MWIDTFTAMPGAFVCRSQKSLSPIQPTVVASSTAAVPKWEFRHASSPTVQSYSLLAEKSMQTSIISGRHRNKCCFSKLTGLLLMAV